jgi:hypothetical protein
MRSVVSMSDADDLAAPSAVTVEDIARFEGTSDPGDCYHPRLEMVRAPGYA